MNLFSLLERAAARYPDNGAVYSGGDLVLTYRQLWQRASALGAAMRHHAAPGDRIVIATKNCPEYLELLFGAWSAGLVLAPINAKLHPREMLDIVDDSGAARLFLSKGIAREMEEQGIVVPAESVVIGSEAYRAMLAEPAIAPAEVGPDDLAWLFFTSGTTGRSKGAMLSHRNLMAMVAAYLADFVSVESGHSLIHAAPMSHGSGLYILPYIARGARHVVPASGAFEADDFIRLCQLHPECSAFLAPTMVQRIRVEAEASGAMPTNLATVVYGGGPMYVEELSKSLDRFGDIFIQLYGQGEAPMTITGLRRQDHAGRDPAILGSVGWPRTGVEIRVADADGQALPLGEVGEILCRGDVVMGGYWNNPEATAATLRDGWLWTGDMGVLDADGKLTLRDRSKDVIISGGTNIYPREVEEVLLTHPAVAEVSVVGRPDPEWGESIAAFIVLEPGAGTDERSLDAYCLARIARFKRPKTYVFVDALPKSSYGKVLKRELAAMAI